MLAKIKNLIFYLLVVFVVINILLAIVWPIITDFRVKSKTFYSDEILKLIGISPSEQTDFYKEMWINRKYEHIQFVGQYEKTKNNQKYLNVDIENGRKIKNNKLCEKNFFFYGASHTFGYNAKDEQTISSQFKAILDKKFKNYCVYNFGSGSYFSTQETIFFMTHLLKDKIKKKDFIFFLDGLTEAGNKKTKVNTIVDSSYEYSNLKYWEKYYYSIPLFWKSLPVVQLYNRYLQKNRLENLNAEVKIKDKKKETFNVFQKNILIRKAICLELEINCYTFLQPFPTISSIYDSNKTNKILYSEYITQREKYESFKEIKHLIDLSKVLEEMEGLSYVDDWHYSPKASNIIATKIYSAISKDLE